MNNLKPCPFCGSAATLEDHRLLWVARCTSCGACALGDRAPEPEQEMPSAYWDPFRQSAVDRWNQRATPPSPEAPAEALAARPLLEKVAQMGNTLLSGGELIEVWQVTNQAAAWLRSNPPGQPVAIEPRGCPAPGACSCVEPTPSAPEPGEVEEVAQWLLSMRELAGEHNPEERRQFTRAATLLQQQAPEVPEYVARLGRGENEVRAIIANMADDLDYLYQRYLDDNRLTHPLAKRARLLLAHQGCPVALAVPDRIMRAAEVKLNPGDYNGSMVLRFLKQARSAVLTSQGEAEQLVTWLKEEAEAYRSTCGTNLASRNLDNAAALVLLQEAELATLRGVPVVVCDRPPEEGDCDAEGNVSFTHWLPAHALPLPVFDEEEKSQLVYELPSNL
jgi:hypothetical protein